MTAKAREDFRVLLVYPNIPLMLVPSLAIGLFTKVLREQDYQVDLFETTGYVDSESASPENRVKFAQARSFDYEKDLGVKPQYGDVCEDFRAKVLEFKPDILLFTVVEDAALQGISLLESVADLNIPHVFGGVFPTAAPERCFEFPVVKMIGLGEGEKTIVAVSEAVRLGHSLHDIPGTWYRDEDGEIHRNPNNELVDINTYRPDFSLFDEQRFYRPMGGRVFKTVPVETYRGCPYACTFCNSPMQRSFAKDVGQGNFLRRKDADTLRAELREIIDRHSPEFFYFIDDSFLARPQAEIDAFCEMYQEFQLPFWFNTRPESCTPDVLNKLKSVGAYRVSFGIECGNEDYRQKVLRRKVRNKDVVDSIHRIADCGMAFSINLIIGFPGETRSLVMDTVHLVRMLRGFDSITVSIFTPYHGTHLRRIAEENGWMDPKIITKHTTSRSLLNMPDPYLSADDIDGLMRVLPYYCYFPEDEWDRIRRGETPDDEGDKILAEYRDIYQREFLGLKQEEKLLLGATGCRVSPKDALRVPPPRLTDEQYISLGVGS